MLGNHLILPIVVCQKGNLRRVPITRMPGCHTSPRDELTVRQRRAAVHHPSASADSHQAADTLPVTTPRASASSAYGLSRQTANRATYGISDRKSSRVSSSVLYKRVPT